MMMVVVVVATIVSLVRDGVAPLPVGAAVAFVAAVVVVVVDTAAVVAPIPCPQLPQPHR